MRPADVMGSWATTHPPGRTASLMRCKTMDGSYDVEEEKPAKGKVHGLGEKEVLAGLGDGDHLAEAGGGLGHLVARQRVAVDGIDPTVPTDDLG